ncbi:MAG: hypothetical protein FWD05_02605 [Oscillospiraceae bacterium]|nr:hypothetical protein [Oscillospiraceae bacterium]
MPEETYQQVKGEYQVNVKGLLQNDAIAPKKTEMSIRHCWPEPVLNLIQEAAI